MNLVKNIAPRQTFIDQPWLAEFLAAKGFVRSSPTSFTNGKASLHFEGARFTADPGNGDQTWIAELTGLAPETLRLFVEQILGTRPFLPESEVARQQSAKQRAEAALHQIALSIAEHPNTGSGQQLRRFLWSLYNEHHLVNLRRLTAVLDTQHARFVAEVFTGVLSGLLDEGDLERALRSAGEMERRDKERSARRPLERLDEAEIHGRDCEHPSNP